MREPDEPLPPPQTDEGALRRWSRRKARAGAPDRGEDPLAHRPEPAPTPAALTDADMPPLESLDEDSDYSAFLSPEVGEELRRLALRKLFHLPKFNVCDGLDDYDDDFRGFEALGEVLTADLRHRLQGVAEKAQAGQGAGGAAPERVTGQGPETAPEAVAQRGEDKTPQQSSGAAPQGPSAAAPQGPDPQGDPPPGASSA